jgi:hypothetical protein
MSMPALFAAPHAADAIVKTTTPAMKTRRRPMRSASWPPTISTAAKTMLYPFKTHERVGNVALGNELWMLGKQC